MTIPPWKAKVPFLCNGAIYLLLSAWFLIAALDQTHGTQIFLTDDAYIHAALAKNLVLHGTFSVSPPDYSSCSSSIIWPLLLAGCFAIFGIHLWIILALNAISALASLWIADSLMEELAGEGFLRTRGFVLFLLVIAASLVVQTFVGLEHNLQILTVLLLLRTAVRVLAGESGGRRALCVYGVLAVMCRYEAVFAIMLIFVFLCWQRRFVLGIVLSAVSAVPVFAASAYGLSKGALLLPNSLLLKSTDANRWRLFPSIAWPADYPLFLLVSGGALLVVCLLIVLTQFLGNKSLRLPDKPRMFLYLVTALMLMHFQFARTGWVLSYEAYLIALALIGCACFFIVYARNQESPAERRNIVLVYVAMAVVVVGIRVYQCDLDLRKGFSQIYLQQFQMARFLAQYYPNAPVAINDIGLIAYYQPRKIMDVYGLASTEITNLKLHGGFDADALLRIADATGVHVALVYRQTLGGALPPQWRPAGSWKLPEPYIVGGDTVSFYAVNDADLEPLQQALSGYAPCLPRIIAQNGYPIQSDRPCKDQPLPAGWIW
ncbi:MAG TPA: hypothetical protein VGI45_13050 [Terracidiphilus sp.]